MKIRRHFIIPLLMVPVCLTGLCILTATFLFRQQSTMTEVLRENVSSRRASVDLEACLSDLRVLLIARVENVSALHERLRTNLDRLREVADQPVEQELSRKLEEAFEDYLTLWKSILLDKGTNREGAVPEAVDLLERDMILPCRQFILYNGRRIEQSTNEHEQILRKLAWGMTGIGVMSGVAGIVLGFGLTRTLHRSIRRLQVQIRDVAGKLGPDFPEVTVTEEGRFSGLHVQLDQLRQGVEKVLRELKQRELEVLRGEQLAAVGHLAAGVAHEIRNPLTSIKLLVQAGQEFSCQSAEGDQSGLGQDDLRVIEAEIRRIESSLQTFLDFARPPRLERRRTDLVELIREAVGLVKGRADKQQVVVLVRTAAASTSAVIDREQIRQVLINLLLNGLDAQPTGGRLTVSVSGGLEGVEIEVSDAGLGIAPEMLSQLFQPFSSNKETGLGLGLVISQRIVEDHGGTLTVANLPQRGASFLIHLPHVE